MRPSKDPFYTPVRSLPGEPGTPVRRRAVSVPGATAASAEQVVYTTTATDGRVVAVSGTVVLPDAPWRGPGPRPVLSYGTLLHGLGRDSAPSHLLARGREPEIGLIDLALQRGWVVAVADGEGLGMPGPHTYGAGLVGGRAMLDLVRAATSHAPVPDRPPVLLWGYSEGGRCAAWAAEQHPAYAPELDLVAVAAGGIPTDLAAVVEAIDGGPYSGLGLAVLVGLARAHGDPRLWEILSERGRAAAEIAATLDARRLVVAHPEPMATYTTRERPWQEPRWRAVLDSERMPAGTPAVPAYLYHASADELVPVTLGRELAAAYERRGVDVTFVEIGARDHVSGAAIGAGGAVSWLAERLAEHRERRAVSGQLAHGR